MYNIAPASVIIREDDGNHFKKKSISQKFRDMSFGMFTIAMKAFCPSLVFKNKFE